MKKDLTKAGYVSYEKKCVNCENMVFCAMYQGILQIAPILNANLARDMAGDLPLVYIANTMAHDCNQFEKIKGGL